MKIEEKVNYCNKLILKANKLIGFDYYDEITTDKPNVNALRKITKHMEEVIQKLERGRDG